MILFDRFMENIIKVDTTGDYRRQNPDYAKARYLYRKAVNTGSDTKTIKRLKYAMENLPSSDRYDTNFRRVKYVRYADDFLIGVIAPKTLAGLEYLIDKPE
jgi:hypothetical protein